MRKLPTPAVEFTIFFLATLLLMSIALNGALILQRTKPDFWRDVRLAFRKLPPITAEDHVRGDSQSSVTIIDYSDYQCPYSKQLHSDLKKLAETSNIKWVLRNKPLDSIHPFATSAAVAAECANRQGRFWEYSDALFDEQDKFASPSFFEQLAQRLNLDLPEFNACRATGATGMLSTQISDAAALEISITPTMFVNGRRFDGAVPLSELARLVQN